MAERVLVDVGAHRGASVGVAQHPKYGFGRIIAVEPARACAQFLASFRDERIDVHHVALSDTDGTATLFAAGSVGGSLFEGKDFKARHDASLTEEVTLVDAATWWSHNVPDGAEVYLKMNCEGAEDAILRSLDQAGHLQAVASLLIDLDVKKIPALAATEVHLRTMLAASGVDVVVRDDLPKAPVPERIAEWLDVAVPAITTTAAARLRHRLMFDRPAGVGRNVAVATILRKIGLRPLVDRLAGRRTAGD